MKDAQTGGSAYAQYYFLREKYGVSYWERFAEQDPVIYKSGDRTLQALVRGDVRVAAGVLGYKVYQYSHFKNEPVEAIWPTDGVPVCLGPVAILRGSPHPNAGKLFVEYMLSTEGQSAITRLLGSYSPRGDVDAPEGRTPLSELKLFAAYDGWREYLEKQSALRAEYGTLFNPESE
jgi:iron(III) transport system substrate-binding protein